MVTFETQDLAQRNQGRPRTFYDFDVTTALERPQLKSSTDKQICFAHSKVSKVAAAIVMFFLLAGVYSTYWQWDLWQVRYQESPVLYLFLGVLALPFYFLLFFASLAILLNRSSLIFDKSRKEVRVFRGFTLAPSYQFQFVDITVLAMDQIYRDHEDGSFDVYDAIFVELQDGTLVSLLIFSQGSGAEIFQMLREDLEPHIPQKITGACISLDEELPEDTASQQ